VLNFEAGIKGVDPHEVMALLMMTQCFDALGDISNTMLLPHWPSAVSHRSLGQLRNAITVGNLAATSAATIVEEEKKKRDSK
jgi:hypothetical protein